MKAFRYCFLNLFLALSFSSFAQNLEKQKEYVFLEKYFGKGHMCIHDIFDRETRISFMGDSLWQNQYALAFLQEKINSNDRFLIIETFPALAKLKRYDLIKPYLYSDYDRLLLRAIETLGTSEDPQQLTVLIDRLHDPFPRELKTFISFPVVEEMKDYPIPDRSDEPRAAILRQLKLYAGLEHLPLLEKLLDKQPTDWKTKRLQELENLVAFLQEYQKVQEEPSVFYQKLLASDKWIEENWAFHKIQSSQNPTFLPLIRDFIEREIRSKKDLSNTSRYSLLMKRKKCGESIWTAEELDLMQSIEAKNTEHREVRKAHIAKVRAEIYAK